MKVLLINPKFPNNDMPWIPLGLMSLSAYLKKFGIETKIIDNNIEYQTEKKLSNLINRFNPDVIGTGGFSVQIPDALKIGKIVKKINKNILLVYGGIHVTFCPKDGLKYGDICVIGEGEKIFLEICKNPKKYINLKKVVKADNFIQNLDEIPFPDYKGVKMEKYTDHLITGEKAISIMTGRGCPYNCLFCASPQIYKRRVRYNSIDYVIAHIQYLIDNYNLKNLRIMDDTFTLNKKRVLEFCDKIEENGFKLNMTCLTNVKNVDLGMFKRMKEVGFSIIAFGIESGNEEILRKINKMQTKKMAKRAVYLAKKAGLRVECLYMIGNIGETKETIMDTINFAKEIDSKDSPNSNWFQFATPFPGSEFYNIASQYGKVCSKNYKKYTHRTPIFIPKGLSKFSMIKLRILAHQECSGFSSKKDDRFAFLPKFIYLNLKTILYYFPRIKENLSKIFRK